MFQDSATDKAFKVALWAMAAIAAAWILGYTFRKAQHRADEQAIAAAVQRIQLPDLRQAETAAQRSLDEMRADTRRRSEELNARREAARAAAQPKVYRWQDAQGTWHLSDAPPPAGTPTEVITRPR